MKPIILGRTRFEESGSTLAAGSTDSSSVYDIANVKDYRPYTLWRAADSADNYLQVVTPTDFYADAYAIVGHNLGTVGADIEVAEWLNPGWGNIASGDYSPTDDLPIFVSFTGTTAGGFRIDLKNMSGIPQLGVLIVGQKLTFERYLRSGWDPTNESIIAESTESQLGHLLGSVFRYRELNLSPQWEHLTPSWIDATFKPVWDEHLSLLKPFMWAWDLDTAPNEVYFVRLTEGARLSMPYDPVRRSLNLNLRGVRET